MINKLRRLRDLLQGEHSLAYEWADSVRINREKSLVYWWQRKNHPPNIGDYAAYDIVSRILAQRGRLITDKKDQDHKLVSVGSVLHFAQNGDALWGTGLNGKIDRAKNSFTDLDVRAVRGPLTREFLQGKGINVPEVYGDPAILLPFFYPASLMERPEKKTDYIVINHMNDDMAQYDYYRDALVSPMQYPGGFIESIVNTQRVVSSSLHGVIIAEAYGIPAVFYDSGSGESMFKYEDYAKGTGRESVPMTGSIEAGLTMDLPELPSLSAQATALYKSFPFDLWSA